MKARLALCALLLLAALVGVSASGAEVIQQGDVRVRFSADFVPHSLPRTHPAPVRIHVRGSIATTDGSHPPPLRWLEVELNRNGRLTSRGLPTCSAPLLQSTSTEQAVSRCGQALVGRGEFRAQISLGGEVPAVGKIVAFNSRLSGRPALLLHFFASVPTRFTLVVPLGIVHKGRGDFGTLLRTKVPRLAGGLGSITEIDLSVGRRYLDAGKRRSYVSAACSAPPGLDVAVFSFARARFRFENHQKISSELTSLCQVRSS
jgi:hypothetical protein